MKILVIAAHPDDEILGCGGTIAKHIKNKDKVKTLILGEGITSRQPKRNLNLSKNKLEKLKKISIQANKKIGMKDLVHHDLPDNRFDSLEFLDIVKILEKEIFKFKPNIIYTHSSYDLNIDHKIISKATITASRPQNNKFLKKILLFEIPSSSEWQSSELENFKPNYFVDISKTIKKKINALKIYKNEMKKWPHPRSVRAVKMLSNLRGAQIGCNAAEAFYLARQIDFEK